MATSEMLRLLRPETNDNKPADHPYTMMKAAELRYAKAKTTKAGVRHLLKCAQDISRPGSFAERGAKEIIEICGDVLAAAERGDAEATAYHSLRLGVSWGQLRTRASI